MSATVLITGASTGIGKATALLFRQKGWNVVATMRSPEKADWATGDQLLGLRLDVTDPASIVAALQVSQTRFGPLDVVVNNAGYSLTGAFELATPEQIEAQFATNVFGLMNVTRAVLPQFRQQRRGLIINIASIGGRMALPLYSLYNATKWAVEGFSESLQYELAPFNIRVKVVEPGPIKTDFYGRSADFAHRPELADYDAFTQHVKPRMDRAGVNGAPPEAVAQVIYRAATDGRHQLRYSAGDLAGGLLLLRKLLPDWAFFAFIRQQLVN